MGAGHDNLPEQPGEPEDAGDLRFPELTARSLEVMHTLTRQKGRADEFYEGALRALADRANPVRAESAAYCLRELVEELERAALAPTAGPRLGDLLPGLRSKWAAAPRRPDDNGLLDSCDPAVFAVDQFLQDADAGHSARKDRAQTTISELDPVQRAAPPDVAGQKVDTLFAFRHEFNHVLHGEEPTDPEWFESRVRAFETFLLAWLRPPTFSDFSEIDDLLDEGPPA